VATILAASTVVIARCGGEAEMVEGGGVDTANSPRVERLEASWKLTRERVIEGAKHDFETAVEGPDGFTGCFIRRFRRTLTRMRVAELAATHATDGEPAAARALNGYGVQDGDACGGRRWVPELTAAATGLRSVYSPKVEPADHASEH
jgi:hypothetical protein